MWYWYLQAQELANERQAEARQSRLGRLARSAHPPSERQRPTRLSGRRSTASG
jgi:hypothetical protein